MSGIIDIRQYEYELPEDRIALFPPEQRDQSKLLVFDRGEIHHQKFTQLSDYVPVNSLLVANNTRVIPARMLFVKPTGAVIQVFLLQPVAPSPLVQQAMAATEMATWKCAIGNLKRWNGGALELKTTRTTIVAELIDREEGLVQFRWNGSFPFATVIEEAGKTPLPPYLKRDAVDSDRERYQTVYAKHPGAVAAPTAGLHLTDDLFKQLSAKGVDRAFVTLHVGAGTFMPVKVTNAKEHPMHEEQVVITRELIRHLQKRRFTIAVGTTSMRVLESIYWYGCKLSKDPSAAFSIDQNDPYGPIEPLDVSESLSHVWNKFGDNDELMGATSIFIHPGYSFKLVDGLLTNFHQPGSTLILLIAAFIGDEWRRVYNSALVEGYKFLSYGDGSLLIPRR